MKIAEIIKKAQANQEVTSEEALGKILGVSGVTIMRWRRGISTPEPENAHHLAELAGIDPAPFVAEMLIQGTKDTKLKQTLERFKRAIAASIALAAPTLLQITENATEATRRAIDCILCSIRSPYQKAKNPS